MHDIPSHILQDEKQKYHIVKAVPKSNRKIVKRQLYIDTPSIYIYYHSLSWLGIFNEVKVAELNKFYGHTPPLLLK